MSERMLERNKECNSLILLNSKLEREKLDSTKTIDSLTKELEAARGRTQALEREQEGQAASHTRQLEDLSNALDEKWRAEMEKRLAEVSVNSLHTTSQTLRKYIQSQFNSLGISANDKSVDDVAREWIALVDATPTMRAGIKMPLGQYALTFVIPPTEIVTVQAADAAVAQIWLLIQSNPDVLLSIRHFATRPDVSPSQLNVLQDILLKGIRAIMEGACHQEVFGRLLVAVHALGWLYVRVRALTDSFERRSILIKTWNDLSDWLLTNQAISAVLYQACALTFNSFEADSGAFDEVLSVRADPKDRLDSSNSALEEGQWLVVDAAMHTAAWVVGDSVRIFSRADILCMDFDVGNRDMTLRFRDIEMEIHLGRQISILDWFEKLIGDESHVRNVGM